ncbi:hypothetical protein PGTUg99_009574 [Puccinia graminis f. sp. tritici]|uniref:Uncharacterized protein n=1 Tax=Puccinia graminis f. sp. tritici TaxID=56615 RepID=A0A5B0Q8Q6_PUCGR|nr:hypothetical protein PGTUg99_009574 [Puccinia graminis f. sp. tritici]
MTGQIQPPQAPKRGLDSHSPSTTDPMDIKARSGQRKRGPKTPSGIPLEYRGVGRVAVTEEGLPSLSPADKLLEIPLPISGRLKLHTRGHRKHTQYQGPSLSPPSNYLTKPPLSTGVAIR